MRTVFVIAVFVACLGCATAVHVPLVRSQLRPLRTQFDTTPTAPPLYLRQSLADFLTQSGADVAQATTANLPLNGSVWPVGGFETAIYVGTPPQVQLVQIDTGSADLLVAQQGCKACPSPKYDPARSSTSRPVLCNSTHFKCRGCAGPSGNLCFYNNTYQTCNYANPEASCSLVGTTFYDVASLGSGSGVAATVGFGGIQAHSGAFDNEWTNMPGVMGMGYPGIAGVWTENTVFTSWVAAGDLKAVFGMCIQGDNGHMTLGEVDSTYFTGSLVYTPVIYQAWYVLDMVDLAVSGHSVGLPSSYYNKIGPAGSQGTILDSGTNTFVIGGEAYTRVQAAMVAGCDSNPLHGVCDVAANATIFSGACFAMTEEQIAAYPPVGVELSNTGLLTIGGAEYLIPHPEKQGHYCMGIQSSGPNGFTILGNVFQSGFYVVFDQENNRLGFAPVQNCN